MNNLKEEIINLLEKKLKRKIDPNIKLSEIDVDSLKQFELLIFLENKLKITIPEDKIFEIDNIDDLVNIINKTKNK